MSNLTKDVCSIVDLYFERLSHDHNVNAMRLCLTQLPCVCTRGSEVQEVRGDREMEEIERGNE